MADLSILSTDDIRAALGDLYLDNLALTKRLAQLEPTPTDQHPAPPDDDVVGAERTT